MRAISISKFFVASSLALACSVSLAASASFEVSEPSATSTTELDVNEAHTPIDPVEALNIPCPSFWSVQPNPSVENSLSYVHDSGKIAISVTYIAEQSGAQVGAETFARVAAEQMNCTLPVRSNILAQAWAFYCENDVEALVYGEPGNLVLLGISGRNEETESYLDNFIKFLNYHYNS